VRAWALALLLVACRSAGEGPYSPTEAAARDTVRAQELNARAAEVIASDPEGAEGMLREALSADLFFGPAHNNLGVLYLKQAKLYEAAGEFEWARKLMPGHPDPRMNLALTLEEAGKTDEAIQTYRTALEVWPGHIGTIQALARLEVVSGQRSDELSGWLDEIALRGETERWRDWARRISAGATPPVRIRSSRLSRGPP
jgi:tetratricopeptide (TPR) repeat protein